MRRFWRLSRPSPFRFASNVPTRIAPRWLIVTPKRCCERIVSKTSRRRSRILTLLRLTLRCAKLGRGGRHYFRRRPDRKGPGCFLVPRWLPDGTRNPLSLQRLKDKLGNRSNASAELEFEATHGWLVGEEGRGIPVVMEFMLHTPASMFRLFRPESCDSAWHMRCTTRATGQRFNAG